MSEPQWITADEADALLRELITGVRNGKSAQEVANANIALLPEVRRLRDADAAGYRRGVQAALESTKTLRMALAMSYADTGIKDKVMDLIAESINTILAKAEDGIRALLDAKGGDDADD